MDKSVAIDVTCFLILSQLYIHLIGINREDRWRELDGTIDGL